MTTAFVLAGGGSLGAVEVGMLAALAEDGHRPDVVIGCSVGAVNAAWIAERPDPEGIAALAEVWKSLSSNDIFPLRPIRALLGFLGLTNYLVPNTGLRRVLERNLPYGRLEDPAIPLHVVATDVLTGQDVPLSTGDAVEALLASTAIPAVFPPINVAQRDLMDGGVANNAPISHAVALGADHVWVLPTGYACTLRETPRSALEMALHSLTLVVNQRLMLDVERYQGDVDLRVVPPLCPLNVSPADFSHTEQLIARAYASTREWLDTGSRDGHLHQPHVGEGGHHGD